MSQPTLPDERALRVVMDLHARLLEATEPGPLVDLVASRLALLPGVGGCKVHIDGDDPAAEDGAEGGRRFVLRGDGGLRGVVAITVDDEAAFAPCAPLVERTSRLLALRLDNARLAEVAAGLDAGDTERQHAGGRFLGLIADAMPSVLYVHDIATRENIYVNRAVPSVLGYSRREIQRLGRAFLARLMHPDDLARFGEHVARLAGLDDGEILTHEYRMRHADGRWHWFLSRDTVFERGADGAPTRILGTATDITEQKRIEDELRQERRRLRSIIEGTNVGTWEWNVQTGETRFDERWAGMIGYRLDDLRPVDIETWRAHTHPDDLAEAQRQLERHFAGEAPLYECEFRMRHRDGRWIWLLDRGKIVSRTPDGEPLLMYGTHTDITARKEAEFAVVHERNLSNDIIASLPGLFYLIDEDGRFVRWNQTFETVAGYSATEMARMSPLDLFRGEDRELIAARIRQVFATGSGDAEARLMTKDGRAVPHYFTGRSVTFDGRRCLIGTGIDISERVRAEEALHRSEERFRKVFENAVTGIAIAGLDGRLQRCNPTYCRLLGRTEEELVGRPYIDFVHPDDRRENQAMVEQLVAGRIPNVEIENRYLRADGGDVVVLKFVSLMTDESGRPANIVGLVTDVTERRRAEQDREALRAQLMQAQKMESIGRLAGGIAHDLNNMLSPIIGYGEILLEELATGDERRRSVERIIQAGFSARDLVSQLLAFSRKQTLAFRTIDVNRTIADFEHLLRRTIPEDVDIALDLAPDLDPVLADMGQIEQVVMNLAVNAADAMPDGGTLSLATSMVQLDGDVAADGIGLASGRYVRLQVRDTGAGMDAAVRERVFEPFFSTKGDLGTGLGLATVYGIVKQHGGDITVASEPGDGTTFDVYLPAADAGDLASESPAPAPAVARGSETVLLVEDNDLVRELARAVLERSGYDVIDAGSCEEALEVLVRGRVDLLLTDVVMPGMNGGELYERATHLHPGTKVLFMSGYADDVMATRGILERGAHFIQKPFSAAGLATKVREALRAEGPAGTGT